MRRPAFALLLGSSIALTAAPGLATASVVTTFDDNVTPDVIFGSGNANGSFTITRNSDFGIELGLRGKLRHNASGAPENTFNSNGDGTYSFNAGVAPTQSAPTAEWSFEWSINSNYNGSGGPLENYFYALGIDTDPGAATTLGTLNGGLANPFDPIFDPNPGAGGANCWDHSMGDNTTPNGGGVEADCSSTGGELQFLQNFSSLNVAQNSWKPHWFIDGFDPTVDGQYDFFLAAFDGSTEVARTEISIIVGAGATAVPEPGTLAALGLGLLGLAGARRRRA